MKNNSLFITIFFFLLAFCYPQKKSYSDKPDKFQHQPYAEKACQVCHNSDTPNARDLVSPVPEICFTCHDEYIGKFVHSPYGLGGCLVCHNAHESAYRFLLNNKEPDLCYSCHELLEKKMTNNLYAAHLPAVNRCTICHTPHVSGMGSMLLKKNVKSLCADCHLEQNVAVLPVDLATINFKHKPVETENSCLQCHDPHAGVYKNHLQSEPMALCLKCHNREVIAYDGSSLTNILELLQNNKMHHGPIKDKDCSGCHSPHGSNFYRLLLAEYPKDFYTDFFDENDYKLCFLCHESILLQDKETTTTTNFRDGKKNLHYLHVNKTKKGRTCRACHEIHASNNFNHIRDSVPFGKINWPLQLKYEALYSDIKTGKPCTSPSVSCVKSGGSCVACHSRKNYNFNKDE